MCWEAQQGRGWFPHDSPKNKYPSVYKDQAREAVSGTFLSWVLWPQCPELGQQHVAGALWPCACLAFTGLWFWAPTQQNQKSKNILASQVDKGSQPFFHSNPIWVFDVIFTFSTPGKTIFPLEAQLLATRCIWQSRNISCVCVSGGGGGKSRWERGKEGPWKELGTCCNGVFW